MVNEALILKYLSEHWPMLTLQLAAFLILLKGYLKLRAFVEKVYQLEKKFNNLFSFCLSKNKDRAIELLIPGKKEKDE